MNASPPKFTFDLDLGHNPDRATFISDAARAALQQQARNDGYAEGLTAGQKTASVAAAEATAAAANIIADRAASLLASLDKARQSAEREAVELAATVGRKLAASLLAAQPAAELEALLVESLTSLDGVPHLVIRCHPDLGDAIRELATQRIAHSGFTGRLIVMGDPDIALGDGRIEWADGGLVRDASSIAADIDNRIAAYLAARANATEESKS